MIRIKRRLAQGILAIMRLKAEELHHGDCSEYVCEESEEEPDCSECIDQNQDIKQVMPPKQTRSSVKKQKAPNTITSQNFASQGHEKLNQTSKITALKESMPMTEKSLVSIPHPLSQMSNVESLRPTLFEKHRSPIQEQNQKQQILNFPQSSIISQE